MKVIFCEYHNCRFPAANALEAIFIVMSNCHFRSRQTLRSQQQDGKVKQKLPVTITEDIHK